MGLKLSVMSGKLEGIRALNTNPLNNKWCDVMSEQEGTVCNVCYSRAMLRTYRKNCVPAYDENARLLSERLDHVPKIRDKVFRISAHGEVGNMNQVINIMWFVIKNPDTHFAWWTKRVTLLQHYMSNYGKPDNLTMIYSNPHIDTRVKVPKYFDKVFNVWGKETRYKKRKVKINCVSKCVDCMLCYTHNQTKQIHEVVK